jgi:hypothetical protein
MSHNLRLIVVASLTLGVACGHSTSDPSRDAGPVDAPAADVVVLPDAAPVDHAAPSGAPDRGDIDGPPDGVADSATAPAQPIDAAPVWSGPTVAGAVVVRRGMVVGQVGPEFLGLSFEKSHLTDGFFTGANAPLIALVRLLGKGVLRIGANDADRTTWDPTAKPVEPGTIASTVGTAAVDDLAAFARATGWRVIYTVNLRTGTPDAAAAEARYVSDQLGASLYALEIGNEINVYGLPYATVRAKWESFAAAIRAAVPGALFVGPATTGDDVPTAMAFAHDEAARLVQLTHHYYRASALEAGSTLAKLLAPDPGLPGILQSLATAARGLRDGYRIDECGSYSNHGVPGVSDSLGAALWALDFFFLNARNGSTGINFHGGSVGMDGSRPFTYAPIEETAGAITGVRPVFLAMLLMSRAGAGDVLETTGATASFHASALAVAEGAVAVVLVNEDPTTGVEATVDVGAPIVAASVEYLEGGSLGAVTGVRLAGAGVSAAGLWSPQPPIAAPVSAQTVKVLVPPASAALLRTGGK